MEKTLVIIKPDAFQRNLVGELITRFEKKGLKIVGLKMTRLTDALLDEHYSHHRDKPFFDDLKKFMKSSPCLVIALEGLGAIQAVRLLCGPTCGREADAGTIRGDFSMSGQCNIAHASDSPESAEKECGLFFKPEEIFDYQKIDFTQIYGAEERNC